MNDPICVLDRPHTEARALLASGAPVFLFVNPVEFHGPHLSLHNDHLVSLGLARELFERLAKREASWPFLSGGELEIGVEPTRGVGSRHTPFDVAKRLVVDASTALADLGARRVVFMTFHGAPLHNLAIEAGVEALRDRGVKVLSPFNAVLRELLSVDGSDYAEAFVHIDDELERIEMMRNLHLDFHAGFFETSMALHYAESSVSPDYVNLPPCAPIVPHAVAANAAKIARRIGRDALARELALAAWGLGWKALEPFPGYTGRPHRATKRAGAYFARRIVDRYEELARDVLFGDARSPAPIMPWTAAVTLGGHLVT